MRYDACIIGAGPDGLAAAALLAARGASVLVIERAAAAGGPCVTRALAPGYLISPYADDLSAIPPAIFRSLDLARRGVLLAPAAREPNAPDSINALREAVIARVFADAARPAAPRLPFWPAAPEPPFPGEELARLPFRLQPASVTAFDPALAGSALIALEGVSGGLPRGGLGVLGQALTAAAEEAGAQFAFGLEASDIRRQRGRVVAVGLADGSEVETRSVISTLDLKRTFLSLFAWNDLPKTLAERIAGYRMGPGRARLLLALNKRPELANSRRAVLMAENPAQAFNAWRVGLVPERPPALLNLISAVDPSMAPDGGAVVSLTLGAIPHTPFDGAWTHEKRQQLQRLALALIEELLPGAAQNIVASELLVPPDFENQLGLTEGDMSGGELSAAQMLGFRPFADCRGTRTPVPGLYLAGPSSTLGPLATCAAGWAAGLAVLADLKGGA